MNQLKIILKYSIQFFYIVSFLLVIVYITISTYSYYSVKSALGYVPPTDDALYLALKEVSNKPYIFRYSFSSHVITYLFLSLLLLPIVIITNLILHHTIQFEINKKLLILSIIGLVLFIISMNMSQFGGWYFSIMLD